MPDETHPLSDYRKSLQDDITAKEKDYHAQITYICAGALAFFLTLNDKFFVLTKSRWQWMLLVSLACLFAAVLLYAVANMADVKSDETLMDAVDDCIAGDAAKEARLLPLWRKGFAVSQGIFKGRLLLMSIGVVFEAAFVLGNLYH